MQLEPGLTADTIYPIELVSLKPNDAPGRAVRSIYERQKEGQAPKKGQCGNSVNFN